MSFTKDDGEWVYDEDDGVRLKQRTIPALRKSASTAKSELAIAPVCEEAARLPDSDDPDFIAAILHPFRIREEACKSIRSGSLMFSI